MINEIIEQKIENLTQLLSKPDIIPEKRTEINETDEELSEYLLYAAEKKAEECVELAISINQGILKSKNLTILFIIFNRFVNNRAERI
jgi:hypothetical protein